ncbi:hypothetical protein BUALT_Bualt16G0051300 [Buddleja alternifolia]|uniref:Protein kinase domain-containing protein n=1 Tax=Buddleja alternifolia TaxID=168488 RepID=A0AAV6WAS0_9LAMI|nr:hypothetical protein BUALT_Bualt16G0051300 [Buddleja alternifolia]
MAEKLGESDGGIGGGDNISLSPSPSAFSAVQVNANAFISIAPAPVPQPNGTGVLPPLVQPPVKSAQAPETANSLPSSPRTSPPSTSPSDLFVPPPTSSQDSFPPMPPIPSSDKPQQPAHPPFTVQAPDFQYAAPVTSPSRNSSPNKQNPSVPDSMPPTSHQTKAPISNDSISPIAPVANAPPPREMPESPPPTSSVLPEEPPSLPPDMSKRPTSPESLPPVKPVFPEDPLSSPPEQNASHLLAPPPSITHKTAVTPVAAPENKTAHHYAPLRHSPTKAPSTSNPLGRSNSAPPPHPFPESPPEFHSPIKHHSPKVYKNTPAPLSHVLPPPTSDNHYSSVPAPSRQAKSEHLFDLPSGESEIPFVSPKKFPFALSPKSPIMPLPAPLQALPPPPPQKDCAPLTCTEPLTYGPPESPCVCVLPIQVGLRLDVALYTFFPLVSELAVEIAGGVFMKQSQVRIMGANAAGDNPEKTIVLIDLLPLGEKFDDTTAYFTFQRFWHKKVVIKTSFFGNYDILYVRYPGLPPSPPLPPSTIGIIPSKPYPGRDNNGRTIQPLGVDIRREQHKQGLNGGILATIIVSAFVAVILVCAFAWVLLFRYRQPYPTPPTTIHSHAKSSGVALSMVGSGPSSPSFSLGSSIAAYTGSAKTFSLSDVQRATDYFNETRILGEGGFGVVYRGVLEDGTKVAMKILKRCDQQGGREFLAEVEMLSRLHHRNLVKLIGICAEDRTRCLVYELIPNGSVDSHLHGVDKETSPLDWSNRLKIALGAGRALAYLHEDSSPRVIHRDFKASNILLEDDFTPKVSDFGLARAALDGDNRHISTRVMGTFGYVAPEYAMTGHLLVKSDVYSYGVVLLELLTGRKPVDMSQPPGQENLVSWARPLLTSREGLELIVDQSLGPDFPFDSIAKVAAIASMCVQPEVSHRPFMGEVIQALKLVWDEMKDLRSRNCSHEDLSVFMDGRNSTNSERVTPPLLTQSPVSDYDYLLDVESDLSMSELLSSSAKFGEEESESFRRHSSSGPLRTGKTKQVWKKMRRLSGGSVSEHGVLFKLWPGSQ